ncbi:MAG: acyltransferase, partial [Chloroflexi bacterium]|nr:acyltransferase [Chloroflexota bacterium]
MSGAGTDPRTDPTAGERGLPHLAGLDGIRGLAALAVVLFHAGVAWLPAGFLGVDVFFVVSGFLITALLIAERERSSDTDLARFWLRRARRLLPVLALVLIVTTAYAALMLRDTLGQHLHDVLMAAVYFTNWDLILRGVSYFEMFERPSQLRHLWSLAVEEQFYIVWPIVFALVMRFLNLRWLWCIVAAMALM